MSVSDAQIAFVQDLFADLGPISTRKMFGGLGIYYDGIIFGIVMSDGALMLKGAADMQDIFAAEDWQRWVYTRKDGSSASMPYWAVPEALLDDPESACDWARRALSRLSPS